MANTGEKLSEETISKMKLSKMQNILSKFKWELADHYLDIKIDLSSRNRDKIFITLREFKEKILSGMSLKDIISGGVSKHIIQFYSNLLQGKISLDRETFVREYEEGLSIDDIGRKHSISRDDITYLRQLYNIKTKGAKFIERKRTETLLTEYQKEVLYGSMMGDGKKMSMSSVAFKHGDNQKEYLLWKYRIFENIASKNSLKKEESIDSRSEHVDVGWRFYTSANTDIEICLKEFYKSGRKEITENILSYLSPLSVAVWYMDDGKTDFFHRSIVSNGYDTQPEFRFCTESFSRDSCEKIQKWFKEKYDIDVVLKEKNVSSGTGYQISICKNDNDKFINLISPYVIPMFRYKISYDNYKELRQERETNVVKGVDIKCPLGADFSLLSMSEQDEHIKKIVKFYQDQGIESLIDSPDKWKDHALSVFKSNSKNLLKENYISFSNLGNRYLMSHFSNFWKARAKGNLSPWEVFNNEKYLSDIIRKIIVQGYFPYSSKILKSLQRYRGNKSVSGFMPCVAKAIYDKYCEEGDRIFDFCAGYGGRLFGAVACLKAKSYTCLEVNFETFYNLNELYRNLRLFSDVKKEVNIFNQDSIIGMKQFSDQSFDFCFTSPPYFDAEEYSDDKGQSFLRYDTYSDWFEMFLIESIKQSKRICKRVSINISNTGGYMIADDLRSWLNKNDIIFKEDRLRFPQYGGGFRFEPIFVF